MTDIKTHWDRWHPKNPVKSTEEAIVAFYDMYSIPYKKYNNPTTVKGDIVEDYQRHIKVKFNKYRCPYCGDVFINSDTAQYHVDQYFRGGMTRGGLFHPALKPGDLEEIEYQQELPAALVYYEIVRPEEIIPHIPTVEASFKNIVSPATVAQRQVHNKEIQTWRKRMKETKDQRKFHIELMPNGDIQEKGAGGKWWYWCPQEFHNGFWIALSPEELETLDEAKQKIRVLFLLAIIPADLEVPRPSSDIGIKTSLVFENEKQDLSTE